MKTKIVTGPLSEPVALDLVKTYLRIDIADDDELLNGFISAARDTVEKFLGRKLITQTLDVFLDHFPSARFNDSLLSEGTTEGKLSEYLAPKKWIEIPYPTLQQVLFLKTYDQDGTVFTMPPGDYFTDTAEIVGRLALNINATWPPTFLQTVNGIQIRFICGYGDSGDTVPFAIRQAVMDITGLFYTARGCSDAEIPDRVWNTLSQFRVQRL